MFTLGEFRKTNQHENHWINFSEFCGHFFGQTKGKKCGLFYLGAKNQ